MAAVFGFALMILITVLAIRSVRASVINRIYDRLSRRYRGELHRGGVFRMPYLRFVYKGAHVLLDTLYSSFPGRPRGATQFHISWPDRELVLKITPRGIWGRVRRILAGGNVRINSPDFERRYHVRGNHEANIVDFLSGGVQHVINQLGQTLRTRDVRIEIADGVLVIRRRGVLREYEDLDRMIRLGLELFDQAMLTRMAGIEITSEQLEVAGGETQCKICGESINGQVVYCLKCRTPHHFDCWQYYGACSTYGCGETRYTRF